MVDKFKHFSVRYSLSTRLLLLTIAFVMLAEVLIYLPSITNFRKSWLEERLAEATIAVLAIEAAPDRMISEMLTKELLSHAKVAAISLKLKDKKQLMLNTDRPMEISAYYDLRNASYWELMLDALKNLFHFTPHGSLIEVKGDLKFSESDEDTYIEIIFQEKLLCHDMYVFSYNVFLLSIIISLITAGLVYYSLSCLLIRPMKRMTRSVIAFRNAPDEATEDLSADGREDEIGVVMRELGTMQNEVRTALSQKKNLTQLGEAISKINHDLRNILSSAQMVADHLKTVDNPIVQKLSPRFVKAIDRAIRLCENTLKYGKANIEKPHVSPVNFNNVVDEVEISLGVTDLDNVSFKKEIPADFIITADPDQIFRVFLNLCRNALQAINERGEITITAQREGRKNIIRVRDDGPGIPDMIRENLFRPFHGSSNGGAGLGLAISKEIIEAHGGTLELVCSDENGTEFQIILP